MKTGHSALTRIAVLQPLLVLLALLLAAPAAWGEECVLLQSSPLKAYEEARQGFERAWQNLRPAAGPKSVSSGTLTQVLLSEQPPGNTFSLKKQLETARLVVVIGDPALEFVRGLRSTPVLYLLAPSAANLPGNFTGIDLRIRPSRQLEAISRLLPKLRSIGALYNPAQTGHWAQEALLSQPDSVRTLLFKKIAAPAELPEALASLRGVVEAYWLLPDDLVTSPQALDTLREFSMTNRVPILSFSEKYLKAGAAAAITFDMADLGAQAAAMANRLFAGAPVAEVGVEAPRKQRIIANTAVLRKMGVAVNEAVVDEVYAGGGQP
ncbi:MAG: ABC transporter substrate-binding protein [Thermodesulfobacteriota bacterium]